MALQRKQKGFQLFAESRSYLGECEEYTPPKLGRKLEEFRASGMDSPIKIDLGGNVLETEITLGSNEVELIKKFASCGFNEVKLRVMASFEGEDDCQQDAVQHVMRGKWEEIDMGTWKAGDASTGKYKATLNYYKLINNGENIVEIDVINHIYNVGGENILEKRNLNMGILF